MNPSPSKAAKTHSVKFNFIMNLVVTCSSVVFPLITFPYVSRMLLADAYGQVSFAVSVINYFSMFAALGVFTYGIRLCARVRDDQEALNTATSELVTITLGTTIIAYAALFILIGLIPRLQVDTSLLLVCSATILFNTLAITWFYSAIENYLFIAVMTLVTQCLSLAGIFIFIHGPEDYLIYGAILVCSAGVSNIISFIHARRFARIRIVRPRLKKHLKPLLVFFLISAAASVYTNLDTVMLGFMDTDTAVGYYSAAVKIKAVLVSVTISLGAVVLPRASYLLEQGQTAEFKALTVRILQFVQLFAIPVCLFLMAFAEPVVLILAGEGFAGAVMPLRIILPAVIFIGLSNITGFEILTPLDRERDLAWIMLGAAVLDFVLNLFLIPRFSASGAALSTAIAEVLVLVVQLVLLRDFLHGTHIFSPLWRIALACVGGFAGVGLLWWLTPLAGIPLFIVGIVVFFGLYAVLVCALRDPLARELVHDVAHIGSKLKGRLQGPEATAQDVAERGAEQASGRQPDDPEDAPADRE